MTPDVTGPGAPTFSGTPDGTVSGAASLRSALSRLERIVSLALAVAVLVLVESYLTSIGVFRQLPEPGTLFNVSWVTGIQLGVGIAVGVAIGVLVIIMIVLAVLGAIAWRRGVVTMTAAAAEMGPAHEAACRTARQDHTHTLWMFLVLVFAAIVVSVTFAGVNGALAWLGIGRLPGTVGTIATSLATGVVLVLIYSFGTRHLVEFLTAIATPTERALLERGRSLMIAGAVLGLGTSFASLLWEFNFFAVISQAVVLPGVVRMGRAYELWLTDHRSVPRAVPRVGVTPA